MASRRPLVFSSPLRRVIATFKVAAVFVTGLSFRQRLQHYGCRGNSSWVCKRDNYETNTCSKEIMFYFSTEGVLTLNWRRRTSIPLRILKTGRRRRRFSAVILVRARRNLRPPTPPRFFLRRPRAAIGETELKRGRGRERGRKGNSGECGPAAAAAMNRHQPII